MQSGIYALDGFCHLNSYIRIIFLIKYKTEYGFRYKKHYQIHRQGKYEYLFKIASFYVPKHTSLYIIYSKTGENM